MKLKLLLILAILLQSIAFAAGQPMYHFILPPDGLKDQAFHIIVIGDSIAWGNGLNEEDKYYHLVADWLEKKLNKPVDVTVYAHSGAKISGSKDLWTFIGDLNPFKGRYDPNMNSAYPTLKEQADSIIDADKVDLILISGGINDVDIMKLINVYTSAKEINQSAQSIKDPMKELLSSLLIKCKNAKIIVTNYYPIVSENSNIDTISAAYGTGVFIINSALNKNPFDAVTIKERLTENSNMFHGGSTTALDNAVLEADSSANRITLAMINFQPNNCYAASQTWLWKLDGLKTNDDQFDYRSPLTSDPINKINAIGHPNRDGAIEYARAIENIITTKGLDWLEPKGAEFWLQKGRDLFNQSKYEESIQCFDEAIKLNQSYIEAWIRKSQTIAVQGKSDEAIKCLDEAIKVNPQSEKLLIAKGGILFLIGRYDEAIQCSNEAITLNQSSLEAWGSKGMFLNAQGKYDEAILCIDEVLSTNPQSCALWGLKGLTLNAQGKYDEAIQCYNEALRINPQNDEIWLNKGNVFANQGNYVEAIRCCDEAIRINPQEGFYWNNKGIFLQNLGRSTEANAAFVKSRELGVITGQTVGYGQGRFQIPKLTDLTANFKSRGQSAETTQDTSVDVPSSDTSAPSETSSDTNTKTAYTQDGINFISKERVEENIKAGIAKSGDYREVQVSLDTIVVGGSTIPG